MTPPDPVPADAKRNVGKHTFESVTPRTLSQRITREIIASILSRHYLSGQFLPTEEELCRQMGVSRSVVREATKAVAMLGIIEPQQGRGTVVLPEEDWNVFAPEVVEARRDLELMDEFLIDLLEVRRVIEVEAAALAAERATEHQLDAMRAQLESMRDLRDDPDGYARADVEFHDTILVATGNRPLRQLLRSIEPALVTARTLSLTVEPEAIVRSIREHQAIYRGIAAGSPKQARKAMASHLSWTANLLVVDNGLIINTRSKE